MKRVKRIKLPGNVTDLITDSEVSEVVDKLIKLKPQISEIIVLFRRTDGKLDILMSDGLDLSDLCGFSEVMKFRLIEEANEDKDGLEPPDDNNNNDEGKV